MIIVRTPFRVTLGGGGTDLPSYYSKHEGFIFAAALDKYMFVSVNQPVIDDLIRLKYSESETVDHLDRVKHKVAREILRFMGIHKGIEISSIADISGGSGLGSSSCYAVGLLHALHTLKREYVSQAQLAEEDFKIEAEILKRPIGKQDPYMAAVGGLSILDIAKDGKVRVRKANASPEALEVLNRNMLMFYTGTARDADIILGEQTKGASEDKKEVVESMHYIKELGYKILEAVEKGNIDEVGKYFDTHWEHKKRISTKMSNPQFDAIYKKAKEMGVLGGKISGAGGGGFFTFYIPSRHQEFRETMKLLGLREMRYRFDLDGSKVLVDF